MAEPIKPAKAETTDAFNPEDYAAFQLRLTPGFSNVRVDKTFPDNEPFSEEGQSQNFGSFRGGVGLHYLVPVGKITSNFWQVSIGADFIGQAGGLNSAAVNLAPSVIHRWGNGQYEWRLEANYAPTYMLGSDEFFFPQDPQGRTFKIPTDVVHEIGAAMTLGLHINEHVMFGILLGGSSYTNLRAQNVALPDEFLDISPTVNFRASPVLTIHPFGSAKTRVYETMSRVEALERIRSLRDKWQWNEIAYKKINGDLNVRFTSPTGRHWAGVDKTGREQPAVKVSRLLDEIYALMRAGDLETGSVRVQIIGHAKETGRPYEDGNKANQAAHALQSAVMKHIVGEPYSRMKPILVAPTHYGAVRKDDDIMLVHIYLPGENPQVGPELEKLRTEGVDQTTADILAQIRALSSEISMIRLSFPNERTTNFADGPNAPFQEVYRKLIEPTLEIMDLIKRVPDPKLKDYLRDNMRIQLTGHAHNPALADPPPGQTEKEYYAKTNRLPQYFLDVGVQRAQGVKTAVLNAIDKDIGGFINAYASSGDNDSRSIRQWLHEIFSIEPAAPFSPYHRVTIRQHRRLYGLVPGQMAGGVDALNQSPYVERVIELHYEGEFFEKTHRVETDNSNHVKFRPLIPLKGRPVKSFKTPFLTNKALCKNTPCDPVESSQTRRTGRTGSQQAAPQPAKPSRGSSEGRGEPR